ncbi:hypothetical protein BG015_007286 [Linnemannia schmuckeri]|uniref:F-box domain-containing protein n=1 Tax=Linnemannia schmuckeri TaxID=64567 RepID=A0A9P5RZ39_9FUNG|nr:hypothetical protein BG015_007286 [Linnemannia schmuckeri]
MTITTHATVFDIHFLQEQICAQLSLRDIRRCCLVSKDFYHNFSPYLYRTIPIHRKSTFNKFHRPESLAALAKYRDQVTHVTCEFAQIWKTLLDHQCHNLVTLISARLPKRNSNAEKNKHQTRYISDLIEVNPRLYSVQLGQFLFEPEVVSRFCSVLRSHNQIRELSIVYPTSCAPCDSLRLLTWSSSRLEKLCLNVKSIKSSANEISDLQVQEYLKLTGSKDPIFSLKELSIPVNLHGHEPGAFIRFLEHTPNIERFVAPMFAYNYQIEGLLSVMQTGMTNIQHLNVDSIGVQGSLVARMISICRNLKSFVSSSRQNGINFVAGALLEHHRESLEEVHMVGAGRMTSLQVLSFLTECPKLQIFDAMCSTEKQSPDLEMMTRQRIGDAILSMTDINAAVSTTPWACTGLKVLKLRYAVSVRAHQDDEEEQEENEESNEWVLPKILYERIAELTELETLWLGRVEPAFPSTDSFILALRVGRGDPVPELDLESRQPESESEIRQYEIGTLNMSKALLAWRSLSKLRQLHLRGLKNFIDKNAVKEARRSWKNLDWIWYY